MGKFVVIRGVRYKDPGKVVITATIKNDSIGYEYILPTISIRYKSDFTHIMYIDTGFRYIIRDVSSN